MLRGILKNNSLSEKIDSVPLADFFLPVNVTQFRYDMSFEQLEDNIESLNIIVAGKNKIIQQQQSRLFQLEMLVDSLSSQIQYYKVKERKDSVERNQSKCLISRLQNEVRNLTQYPFLSFAPTHPPPPLPTIHAPPTPPLPNKIWLPPSAPEGPWRKANPLNIPNEQMQKQTQQIRVPMPFQCQQQVLVPEMKRHHLPTSHHHTRIQEFPPPRVEDITRSIPLYNPPHRRDNIKEESRGRSLRNRRKG